MGSGKLADYLTTAEAAEKLGYNVESVRRMLRTGKIQGENKAGAWLVHCDAIRLYQESVRGKAKHDPTRGT